jgi:DNA recombination protein RmuC
MDTTLILALAALAALGLIAVALLLRRSGGDPAAALAGRLDQMAKDQAATQAALAKALDDRLAELGKRVGDRLHEQTTQAQQSMTDLKERLAVIDAAHKNIA